MYDKTRLSSSSVKFMKRTTHTSLVFDRNEIYSSGMCCKRSTESLLHATKGNIKCVSISSRCYLFSFKISRDAMENSANIIGLFEIFVMVSPRAFVNSRK